MPLFSSTRPECAAVSCTRSAAARPSFSSGGAWRRMRSVRAAALRAVLTRYGKRQRREQRVDVLHRAAADQRDRAAGRRAQPLQQFAAVRSPPGPPAGAGRTRAACRRRRERTPSPLANGGMRRIVMRGRSSIALAPSRGAGDPPPVAHARRVEQHAPGPAVDVELLDQAAHAAHAVALLVGRHGRAPRAARRRTARCRRG